MHTSTTFLASRFPAFAAQLDAKALQALCETVEPVELAEGALLYRAGAQVDSLYLLSEGRLGVSAESGGLVIELDRIEGGSTVGETALLDPGPAVATVIARSPAKLLRLTRTNLDRLGAEQPRVVHGLLRAVCALATARIRATDERCDRVLRTIDPQRSLVMSLRQAGGRGLLQFIRDWFAGRRS